MAFWRTFWTAVRRGYQRQQQAEIEQAYAASVNCLAAMMRADAAVLAAQQTLDQVVPPPPLMASVTSTRVH